MVIKNTRICLIAFTITAVTNQGEKCSIGITVKAMLLRWFIYYKINNLLLYKRYLNNVFFS